jgi:hypothetical protein
MHHRFAAWIVVAAVSAVGCGGTGPEAAPARPPVKAAKGKPGDEAALGRIDQAVNDLYLASKVKEAETRLLGIIERCQDECSGSVQARGWMYVGVVRGGGSHDQDGSRDAFERAVKADRHVQIDQALATPETLRTFESVRGSE